MDVIPVEIVTAAGGALTAAVGWLAKLHAGLLGKLAKMAEALNRSAAASEAVSAKVDDLVQQNHAQNVSLARLEERTK